MQLQHKSAGAQAALHVSKESSQSVVGMKRRSPRGRAVWQATLAAV